MLRHLRPAFRVFLLSATALAGLAPAAVVAQVAPDKSASTPTPEQQADSARTGIIGTTARADQQSSTGSAQPETGSSENAAGQSATAAQNGLGESGDIVVTGIRGSLQSATNAKRNSVAFGDSIFAEDIGKLPATNIAETLNRIPGVRLNRDINGEGVQVAVRGLGPSFTQILLNNTQIAVASDGGTNGGAISRGVDLDFFPSELFTRLDVEKTPVASTLEGGIAGTINLRNARPFDNPGNHVTLVSQGQYTDSNGKISPRGALVASHTSDHFGILVGVAGVSTETRVDGYETVGFTNTATGGFRYASVVPGNVGHGLTTGSTYDPTTTSGLSATQLANAIIPRLGRNSYTEGTRSRITGLVSLEWRPSDVLSFALDGTYTQSKRNYIRLNMNWYVRNSAPGTAPTSTGGMVPIGLTVDSNNVVTKGTFANSVFFLENDIFNQTTDVYNVNPSMTWKPTSTLTLDAQVNYGRSTFFREQPQFDFQTTRDSGTEVYYDNTNGYPQPIITTNRDLGDPNLGWKWYRVNVQEVRRTSETKGAHADLTFEPLPVLTLKTGVAYDDVSRTVRAYDNSTAFQTSVCGATCDGLSGSVPNSAVAQYLARWNVSDFGHLAGANVGYTSMIMPNLAALEKATNYASFRDSAPQAIGAVTGGATGEILEKTIGGYFEVNGTASVFNRDLHLIGGVRYFHTYQTVVGPTTTANGIVDVRLKSSYSDLLPSFNAAYDLSRHLKLRVAASRTLTRADPNSLLPGLTFSDISAQIATAGNPNLTPYTSTNLDAGGEFYTGGIGYIGVSYFHKDVEGFTAVVQNTVPFTSLGINFNDLQTSQQQALNNRGGPGVATVVVNQPVNLQDLQLQGLEVTWVQPLDFLVKGVGFSANGTHITQRSDSGLFATGISPYSYNLQGFYEGYGFSISLNYVWNDQSLALNAPQNNIPVGLYASARGQFDLSAGYQLPFLNKALRLTVDALNLTNAPIRTTFGYNNATYSVYYPGRQVLFGVRAKF
jgi:TonB-dependent receptor